MNGLPVGAVSPETLLQKQESPDNKCVSPDLTPKKRSKKIKDVAPSYTSALGTPSGMEKKSMRKKAIPQHIRMESWNRYIGKYVGCLLCPYCHTNEITQFCFEAGHIVSEFEGGEATVNNLRPICGLCNKSLKTKTLELARYQVVLSSPAQTDEKTVQSLDIRRLENMIGDLTQKVGELTKKLEEVKPLEADATKYKWWIGLLEKIKRVFFEHVNETT